jgi:predicted ATPase
MPLTPDQRLRVFVSSTLGELAEERVAAREAITRLRLTPVLFELGARPHPPRDLYRSYLAQSHIFVGIYWERYGWVAPEEDISGLEDEYLLSGEMPKLIYIKESKEREPRLEELLQRITADDKVSYKRFGDPDQLRSFIENDLALMLTERFEMGRTRLEEPETVVSHGPKEIPIQPTPFVGREREANDVVQLLARPDVRMVTLTGPGGMGKSRLAYEVASRLSWMFGDGIAFVSLSTLTENDDVPSAIAEALGVTESAERSVLRNLQEYLRTKELLLLLDNFEHVVGAGPVLSDLLATCHGVKMMVTSRAALRLRSEHEYEVPPLAIPPNISSTTSEGALDWDALKLFSDRAESANSSFRITPDNLPTVIEICSALDGLPLAIELAAARMKLLTPEAMLPRLFHRLQLLTGGPRDVPERQKTLRATLDWDYELLSAAEQRLFRRLAVFAGGFRLAEAERVCSFEEDPATDVLEVIESLVSKSLIRQTLVGMGEPRFGLLRTLREYAFDRLEGVGEDDRVRDAHAAVYLAIARDAAPRLRSKEQVEWLELLELEHDNIRAALRWLARSGQSDLELELAGTLARFWEIRGHLSEGQRWLEGALSRASNTPPALRADALDGAGILARSQGELKRATVLLEECVALRREMDDPRALAISLRNLGNIHFDRGDYVTPRVLFEESVELMKNAGDEAGMADAYNNLGVLATYSDDWQVAGDLYMKALDIFRERSDTQGEARALMNLGEVRLVEENYEEAGRLTRESLRMFQEIGSQWDTCYLFENLAAVLHRLGRPMDAAQLLGAAEALRELLGAPLPPAEVGVYEERVRALKEDLEPDALASAWEEGRRLDLSAAIRFALT